MPGATDRSIDLPAVPQRINEGVAPDQINRTLPAILRELIDYLERQREILLSAHDELARAINDLTLVVNPATLAPYAITNVTVDRAYDADTVAVAELADVVGTLLNDLKNRGII